MKNTLIKFVMKFLNAFNSKVSSIWFETSPIVCQSQLSYTSVAYILFYCRSIFARGGEMQLASPKKIPGALKVKVRGAKSSRNKRERVRTIFRERITTFQWMCERKRLFLEGRNRSVVTDRFKRFILILSLPEATRQVALVLHGTGTHLNDLRKLANRPITHFVWRKEGVRNRLGR